MRFKSSIAILPGHNEVQYHELPMSLADACMVRMVEIHSTGVVLTLDRHFKIYRRNNRQPIAAVMPED